MGNPGIAEDGAHEARRDGQIDGLAQPGSLKGRSNLPRICFSFISQRDNKEFLASLTATQVLRPELDISHAKDSSKPAAISTARIICTIG